METMIERVEAAMISASHRWMDETGLDSADLPYDLLARAAIEAMRCPTGKMLDATPLRFRFIAGQDKGSAAASWAAMIDAALD